MKKSGFAKGVIWTLSIGIALVVILAVAGIVAYNGYTDAALEASYSRGNTETTIKIEKKDKLTSEIASVDKKQVKFNEDLLKDKKKLNFKESGPFYGIKENGRMVRGILKGFQNKGFKTDFYGLFTKNQLMWKGYSEIKYDDGRILYQYNEYKLDKNGKVIVDKDGIYQLVDSYLISKEDFAKVRKYIAYDISIPFKLYYFEETNIKIADNQNKNKEIKLSDINLEIDKIITVAFCSSAINYDFGISSIAIGIEQNCYSKPISYSEYKSRRSNFNEENLCINKELNFAEYSATMNCEEKSLAMKQAFYKINLVNELKNNRYNFSVDTKITNKEIDQTQKVASSSKITIKIKAIICGETDWNNAGKYMKLYIFNDKNKSCEDINNTKTINSEEYFNILENPRKYAFAWGDLEQSIKNKICVNNMNTSVNNFSEKCSANETEIFVIGSDGDNIFLGTNKYNKTQIVKKELPGKNIKYNTDEKYYALVIGNNNYEHLEKLDAAEKDAEVIADVLTNKYGFEVDLLLNADYDTTVNSLFKITNKLKKDDNLLIYYAGHGELDKAENRGYWLPVDASYELRSKWISNQRIVDRIKATKAKHVLLIADSCFSGTLMRSSVTPESNEALDEKNIDRLKSKKTRLVITSGGNEPVVDSDGGDHSLFALKLIDTLKNNNTVINSQMLFENIRRYVISNADQTPERALVHKTGHDGGDFLFFPIK